MISQDYGSAKGRGIQGCLKKDDLLKTTEKTPIFYTAWRTWHGALGGQGQETDGVENDQVFLGIAKESQTLKCPEKKRAALI